MAKSKVSYWVMWLVESQADAFKAISQLIENGDVVSSFGRGEEQYEGFDAEGGSWTISDNENGKVGVIWSSVPQEVTKDYWMSPTLFENVQTFDDMGNDAKGEAMEWGCKTL